MNQYLERELLARLDDLAKRVGNIEQRLDAKRQDKSVNQTSSPLPAVDGLPDEKPVEDSQSVFEPPKLLTEISAADSQEVELSKPAFLSEEDKRARLEQFVQRQQAAGVDLTGTSEPSLGPTRSTPAMSRGEAAHSWDLERWIGARWYAGAGALIVVVGIGLFIKLAFDRGWFQLAPAVRCLLGVAFGGGLIGLGEFVRKRIAPLGALGLYAAGLGSIFASTYAAYRMYALLDAPIAFALLALVALFGVAISVRAKLPSVAILSLLAGFVTPYLFFDAPPRPFVLPAYTLTLLAVGLGLTAWKGASYRVLRSVAWWGTVINGSVWLVRAKPEVALVALVFLSLVWVLVHAELSWSAIRNQLSIPSGFSFQSNVREIYKWRPLLTSFTTSAWAVGCAIPTLQAWNVVPMWLAPGALMAATALLSGGLAGFPRPFIEKPTNDVERFAACLVLQSIGALIATVTLAFTGMYEVVAWGLLSLSVMIAAKWLRARPFYVFSLVCLNIATARLVLYDSMNGTIAARPVHFLGLGLSLWTACMACCAGLWWMAARFIADEPKYASRPLLPAVLAGAGCLAMMGSVVIGSKAQSLAYAWMACAIAFAIVERLDRRLGLLVHATTAAVAATVAVGVAFPLSDWANHRPLWHPGLAAGLAIVATFAIIGVLARRAPARAVLSRIAAGAGVVVLFVVSSLEVARLAERFSVEPTAQRSALSIWWALFGVALIVVGFWHKVAVSRQVGLALLGVAAAKAVFLDLAGVPQTWRVASFLGIGLLMIGVGVAYSKVSIRLKENKGETESRPR